MGVGLDWIETDLLLPRHCALELEMGVLGEGEGKGGGFCRK